MKTSRSLLSSVKICLFLGSILFCGVKDRAADEAQAVLRGAIVVGGHSHAVGTDNHPRVAEVGAFGVAAEIWGSNLRAQRANGFQEVYQRIPFQLSSVQFRLKQFRKILIPQGFSGLFGTDMN